MRALEALVTASIIGLVPARALARSHHGHSGATVRDHRSSSSSSGHSGGGHWGGATVRDHRGEHTGPIVRDHRGSSEEHHGDHGESYDDDDDAPVYYDGADDGGGGLAMGHTAMPTMTFEAGGLALRFRGPAFTRSGTLSDGTGTYNYTLTGGTPSAADTAAAGADLRATLVTWPHLYLGAELQLGGVTRSPIRLMSDSSSALHLASSVLVGFDAVAGARVRRGPFELDGEVAGGFRAISTSIEPMGYDASGNQSAPTVTELVARPLVEGRVRGVFWLASRFYLAAQVGASPLDISDQSIAVLIGVATRPFASPN